MKIKLSAIAAAIALSIGSTAFAAGPNATADTQRDVNQQERIEQGLKSGELNTKEAAKLEHEETKVEHDQAAALKNGSISPSEQKKITAEENRVSQDIHQQKHDAQTGNPNSASSQRMQADVQRNINQQERIEKGERNGSLTNREAGKLERGQARDTAKEARAGADGHVGPREQNRIQTAENHQSARIHHKKHNEKVAS